jgi:hypothetical protein
VERNAVKQAKSDMIIVRMRWITINTVLIVLGIIFFLSIYGASDSSSLAGGTFLLLGALARTARKKQRCSSSMQWLIAEVVSLLIIASSTLIHFARGDAYKHPITFLVVPFIVTIAWFSASKNASQKTTSTHQ